MTRRMLVASLLAVASLIAGCGIFRPTDTLRYRLTVEVDTPQGLRTGSSIIEVSGVQNPGWVTPEGRGTRSSFKGEAVAVDMPDGRTLFALLRTESGGTNAADYPWLAFRDRLGTANDRLEAMRLLRSWKGEVALMPSTETTLENGGTTIPALPLLVTFRDIQNPATVTRVDPKALDNTFGAGVTLKRITLMITDEPITNQIDERLSWRARLKDMLNGKQSEDFRITDLAAHVSIYDFSSEHPR